MVLDRSGFRLVVDEQFRGRELDSQRWVDHYLPHWGTPDRTAARFSVDGPGLTLRIDPNQPPWSPDLDGDVRVSALQSGTHSGPVGSPLGQHHFRDGLSVRTEQPTRLLWTPHRGIIEIRMRPSPHPRALTALWLIGIETEPRDSGEVCVVEVFGRHTGGVDQGRIGVGVHPFGDDRLVEDYGLVPVRGDLREWRTYSVVIDDSRCTFFVDDVEVASTPQAPQYPLQLMLTLYDLPPADGVEVQRPAADEPIEAQVAWVREWQRSEKDQVSDAGR